MQRNGLLGHARGMAQKFKRFDQLVSRQRILSTKTIRIRALLNFGALERCRGDSTSRNYLALMNPRTDARSKPCVNLAELHVCFGERDALHGSHRNVGL